MFAFEKLPVEPPLPFALSHETQDILVLQGFCSPRVQVTSGSSALGLAVSVFIFQRHA